jgi:hypothetical protein
MAAISCCLEFLIRAANAPEQRLRSNLPKFDARAGEAGDRLWLTFYLCGAPESLKRLSSALGAEGWVNPGGWEGAFLYPKVEVERAIAAILERLERARQLCAAHETEILSIDADTRPDARSRFVTLPGDRLARHWSVGRPSPRPRTMRHGTRRRG